MVEPFATVIVYTPSRSVVTALRVLCVSITDTPISGSPSSAEVTVPVTRSSWAKAVNDITRSNNVDRYFFIWFNEVGVAELVLFLG